MKQTKQGRGFTLLELLIVIAIIAILSVILVLVLNPAETLKKSRDAQRISDLSTVKTALGLILTASSTPYLDASSNGTCNGGGGTETVYLSASGFTGVPSGFGALGGTGSTTALSGGVNGTGWIPVAFSWLSGGSPISNLPVDPVNTGTSTALVDSTLVYRYACDKTSLTFEVDGRLESDAYTTEDPKMSKDGGNNTGRYETGTGLTILP